ncbi:AT-rich interactive domain-containing protein 2 [Plakobranchus ocellatus]|uniref:AT-rich interactive domain-containing protein 2 n=1 Tax=Plakobranchus ocellatus TaxID=259542 RepID=A0AAV4BSE9_9GAST|nr:AT-rich interactive domain-containing protein 2 [Plakobranchus ocellatus]
MTFIYKHVDVNEKSADIYQVPSSSAVGTGGNAEKSVEVKPAEAPKPPPPPLTDIHATSSSWLNATFELKKKSKVNQVELFSEYLQFCRKFGITNAMSSADFLHLVKAIFPQCEVISINRKNGDNDVFFEGLCKRSTQKPFAVTTLPPEKVRNPVSVNVSPKQTLPHPVDSLAHTPTLRRRLMEPPRVPLSPHRYFHPGATVSSSSSSVPSTSSLLPTPAQASSPKTTSTPATAKSGRTQSGLQGKGVTNSQISPGRVDIPAPHQVTSTSAHPEVATLGSASHLSHRPCASQTHPSIQQALQQEHVGEGQSVKSLLAKKLSHTGTSETEQINLNNGEVPATSLGQPLRAAPQPQFRISNSLSQNPHQNNPAVSSASTSQSILIQPHHSIPSSLSCVSSASSSVPCGRFIVTQPSHSATMPHAPINSMQNAGCRAGEVQQKTATAHQKSNPTSNVQIFQHPGAPAGLGTPVQVNTDSLQQFPISQQNGPHGVPQVGSLSTAHCQQTAQLQLKPSSAPTIQGNSYGTQSLNPVLQNQSQTQNNLSQVTAAFPSTVVRKMAIGQPQQQPQQFQNTINLVPGSVPGAGVLRAPSSNLFVAGQQVSRSAVTVQGSGLTQAISSPAVAALLTSNTQQGSPQMIISSPMLGATSQAQIIARPPQQQPVQQTPATVVIQTPPGTIVMPSRQLQGGTVSFIVPPQYRQGSPVTFIQQQPSGATGAAAGVNMLPSLAIANSSGGGQQPLPAQQRQIVLAPPGQTSIPVGMQISSLQGNAIIRNHPVCINSMPQQQQQQHNYVIQTSSSQISATASSQSPNQPLIPQQTPPVQGAGPAISSTPESQLARSEEGTTSQQSSGRSVVIQQIHCNGLNHDQNGVQNSVESLGNDLPPSPIARSEKEMLNGKCSSVDLESEHIKNSLKLSGKMNGIVHTVSEHSKDTISASMQTNASHHGSVMVNGSVPTTGQLNQHTNIPVQGLQIRPGMANGTSQLQASAVAVGPPHSGNHLQSQVQQQQQPVLIQQQLLQQTQQLPSQQQPQLVFQAQQQTAILPQQQQQASLPHQGQKQVVHLQQQLAAQQPPHIQRVVSVRPAHQAQQGLQQPQNALRPRISTLSSPIEQQQQVQQALQAGPRPAGLPRSGSAPTGQACGSGNSVATNTFLGTNQTPVSQISQKIPPVSGGGRKRPPPTKPVTSTPIASDPAGRLRKKKPGPNEIVVTPASVQTRKQGQKPVHIAMQYMCEWGSCRKCFSTARLVLIHVFKQHVPIQDSSCQWVACEKLVRKRWSLISHIQDHHCSEMAMRAACQRRYTAIQQKASGATPTPPPAAPTPMIYPPDAAMQAIRRFSVKQPYAEFAEQREGPVSKHIRLTAALIIRNICHASSYGRRLVRQHEEVLSYNLMNAVESSTALSHCLWEISQCCDKDPHSLAV